MKRLAASLMSIVSLLVLSNLARADFISGATVVNRGSWVDPSGTTIGGSGYVNASDGVNTVGGLTNYVHLSQIELNYASSATNTTQTIYTYCVNMFAPLQNSTVTQTSLTNFFANSTNATEIGYLYEKYGTTSHLASASSTPFSTASHDFALQLAIWDLSLNHSVNPNSPFSPTQAGSVYFNVNTPAGANHGNAASDSYVQQYMMQYLNEAQTFVNSGGTVSGVYVLQAPSGNQSVLYAAPNATIVQPVPEPSSFMLTGLGSVCVLAWYALKRRQLAFAKSALLTRLA